MTDQASAPPLPTFLIIGAQKSATRWLRSHLGEHPDVATVDAEVAYFNHDGRYALGADWYRSQFREAGGAAHVGESTPGYLMWRHDPATVASRIAETVPDVRLIAVLRDPVDRARSALVHHRRHERVPPSTTLIDYVTTHDPETDRLGIVAGGWYARSLAPFVERFGDALAVLLHDDVRDAPEATFATALAHIGARPGFVPDDLAEVRFSNAAAPADVAADSGTPPAPDAEARAEHRARERRALLPLFARELDDLEALLERDLSRWRHV